MKWMLLFRHRCRYMLHILYILFVLPLCSNAYFTLEYPTGSEHGIFPSHDLYGSFDRNVSQSTAYDYTAAIVRLRFKTGEQCSLQYEPSNINLPDECSKRLDGYVLYVSSRDILDHQCNGMAEIFQKLNITRGHNSTPLHFDSYGRSFLVVLFSSITLQHLQFGGPSEFYGKHFDFSPVYGRTAITDFYSGQYLDKATEGSETLVIRIVHEYGPWNSASISYKIALNRRTLFILLLFSLIYASCQIINLFYQEGWVVDTRIILYVSSVIWFIGSLVRLSVGEITTWYDLVYHSMKLVAFSGYGFVQLKWGQILLKLFNHPIYKFSIYWGIFTIVSNAIVIVLLIVRSVYPYYDYGGYIVKIYSFYIPVLFIGQSFFFLFYGIQFYRGIKVFCLSERTTASFKKLASLNFLAGVGFTVQAAALIVQGTSLPATVAGDMLMFTLAIVSGIICFSPAFAVLSIRGTDEHATYAAILNHTWVPSQSNLNASKLRTDSTSNEEEIKLQRSPSRQPLRNEANYRSKANSSSLTLANSNALDFSENECAPSGPINHFESTHRVDFTPLNPPPRPHMRRDHPNEPLQNGSRRLLSDEEDNPAEMVIEIHLMQDPSFTTDWNAPFEHSSDGTFIDEKM